MTDRLVERKGVEPSTFALRTRRPIDVSEAGKELATTANAVCTSVCTSPAENDHEPVPIDPDLALLIDRWPTLPTDTKAAIVALLHKADGAA